jgi:translation initiation factor IF-3
MGVGWAASGSTQPKEDRSIPARSRSKFRIVAPEKDGTRINERIRVREVRVIGSDSEQLGVMTPEAAMEIARQEGLDLVEVAANSRPPVCRIMDYGKYKYEQKKKKASKQSHSATLKEVKMRPGTDQHDLNFKLNNVRRFLMDGDKVKVTVMFRGREMVHTSRGRDQLAEVVKQLGPIAKMENPPRMEGRFMSMIIIGDREAIAEAKRRQAEARANATPEELVEMDRPVEEIDDVMDDDDEIDDDASDEHEETHDDGDEPAVGEEETAQD